MIYAIGDIHGRLEHVKTLYDLILQDIEGNNFFHEEEHTIVFLGDYINRGPKSLGVLDFLATRENTRTLTHIFIIGNHELYFMEAVKTAAHSQSKYRLMPAMDWVSFGGKAMLVENFHSPDEEGFEKFLASNVWCKYVDWIDKHCVMLYETDDYVFVHGGINPNLPLNRQDLDYVTTIRHRDVNFYQTFHKMVVHGHSPNPDVIIERKRVNVDVSWSKDYIRTKLSAVVLLNNMALWSDIRVLDLIIPE